MRLQERFGVASDVCSSSDGVFRRIGFEFERANVLDAGLVDGDLDVLCALSQLAYVPAMAESSPSITSGLTSG